MIWLVSLTLIEIIADFALEHYANFGGIKALLTGVGGYLAVVFLLIKSLRNSSILFVNGMWDGISALLETLAAIYILRERFIYKSQYFGLFLIIIGMLLMGGRKDSGKFKSKPISIFK